MRQFYVCQEKSFKPVKSILRYDEDKDTIEATINYECPVCGHRIKDRLIKGLRAIGEQLDRIKKVVIGVKGIEVERSECK